MIYQVIAISTINGAIPYKILGEYDTKQIAENKLAGFKLSYGYNWDIKIVPVIDTPWDGFDDAGFGLLEVMLSMSISMIIMFGIMASQMNSLRQERNVASLTDYSNLEARITMFISNPNLCPNVIGKTDNNALDLSGETITAGTRLQSGSIVTSVSLLLIGPTSNPNEYSSYILLDGDKNPMAIGSKSFKQVKIPVTVTLSGTTVTACQLTSTIVVNTPPAPSPTPVDYGPLCTSLGGTWAQDGSSHNWGCTLPKGG